MGDGHTFASNMDLQKLERQYLSIAKMYGCLVGAWPYQSERRRQLLWFNMYTIVIYGSLTQVARIAKSFSLRMLTDQIPYLVVGPGSILKHSICIYNASGLRDLVTSMLSDWKSKKTPEEEAIMEKYAKRATFFMLIYAINAYICVSVFLFVPFIPRVLDLIVPLNESRPRYFVYPAYYFIDNAEDYYYPILTFNVVATLTVLCAFIAADTMLVYVVQHACTLLALTGHRFKNSLNELCSSDDNVKVDSEKLYRNVCYAVDTHKRALAYLTEIEEVYAMNLLIQMAAVVVCFTITLLKVATVTLSMETYPYYGYAACQLVHILFLSAQGQFVIDLHDDVYQSGYNASWYNVHYRTQELFVLILRKSLTPPLLTAGGLIQLNMDTYMEIVKTCISYFTVLKSV